jgi:hypothetical protein
MSWSKLVCARRSAVLSHPNQLVIPGTSYAQSNSHCLKLAYCGTMTFSIMTFNIMALSIRGLFAKLDINDIQHKWRSAYMTFSIYDTQQNGTMSLSIPTLCIECYYYFAMLSVIMLNVAMLNVIMLNVVMLNVVMLNIVMLNVVMLNVIMLSVVAPLLHLR